VNLVCRVPEGRAEIRRFTDPSNFGLLNNGLAWMFGKHPYPPKSICGIIQLVIGQSLVTLWNPRIRYEGSHLPC
jgi:hypothetical protein